MNKIQNTHDAEYWNIAHLCSEIVKKWCKRAMDAERRYDNVKKLEGI